MLGSRTLRGACATWRLLFRRRRGYGADMSLIRALNEVCGLRCLRLIALVLSCAGAAWATAIDIEKERTLDPLVQFPALPKPQPTVLTAPSPAEPFIPGVAMRRNERVVLDGVMLFDHGPADGLEVLACLKDGKTHESLIRLDATNGQLIKAGLIAGLGLSVDGVGGGEGTGLPARGTPVRLRVEWADDTGGWQSIDASSLIRDRVVDRAYPPLPFIYTGSRMLPVQVPGANGQPAKREQFMLDATRSVVVNFDEPDALFASPFPSAREDSRFETNSAVAPPAGTKVRLICEPATLALTLELRADGSLSAGGAPPDASAIDDPALDAALVKAFGADAKPDLRAVGVRVAADQGRQGDVLIRTRILAAAVRAKVWVVPVFVLAAP